MSSQAHTKTSNREKQVILGMAEACQPSKSNAEKCLVALIVRTEEDIIMGKSKNIIIKQKF